MSYVSIFLSHVGLLSTYVANGSSVSSSQEDWFEDQAQTISDNDPECDSNSNEYNDYMTNNIIIKMTREPSQYKDVVLPV